MGSTKHQRRGLHANVAAELTARQTNDGRRRRAETVYARRRVTSVSNFYST